MDDFHSDLMCVSGKLCRQCCWVPAEHIAQATRHKG